MEKFSVKKPFTVLVAVIMVIMLGLVSVQNMQTNLLPNVNTPYLMVVTVYPGASPERVENEVSDVMESALGTISGVKNVTATSAENYSLLLMEFEDDTDMNSAVVKVSNKVDQTTASLPSSCMTPSIIEYTLNMNAFMTVAVSREGAVYAEVPHKFEAGTVNAGGAVGLEAAIHYIEQIGFDRIQQREEYLSTLMLEGIKKIPHVHLLGADTPEQHHGIFSFTVDDVHPHDVSAILADAGIAVRAGHHCAQPLVQHLGVNATTRASLAFYNTEAEVEAFLKTLREVRSQMGYAE